MRLYIRVLLLSLGALTSLNIQAQLDLYWVGGSGNWNNLFNWSLTSGGPGGAGVPSIQDNVFFDVNSFGAKDQRLVITEDAFCNSMDWTGVSNSPIMDGAASVTLTIYGSLTFDVGMRHFFEGNYEFRNSGTNNFITSAGVTFLQDVSFEGQGQWIVTDDLSVNGILEFREGAIMAVDIMINAGSINSDFQTLRSFDFGTSTIQLMQRMEGSPSSAIFKGNNLSWATGSRPSLFFSGTTSLLELDGDAVYTFDEVVFNSVNGVITSTTDLAPDIDRLSFIFNGEINGDLQISEWVLAMGYPVFLENGSTQLVSDIITADECDGLASLIVKDDGGAIATVFFDFTPSSLSGLFLRGVHAGNRDSRIIALFNSQNGGNNGNLWVFGDLNSNDKFWVGGTGDWNDRNNWSDESGGAPGACIPKPNDNVFFDNNSFVGEPNAVVSGIALTFVNNFTFTASNFNGSIQLPSLYVNGNMTMSTLVIWDIPEVFLIGNDQQGNSTNSDSQFINTGPVTLNNLTSRSQRRVLIESDLMLNGTLTISGLGSRAQFVLRNRTITAGRVVSTSGTVSIIIDQGHVVVTGERIGDDMPLILDNTMITVSPSTEATWTFTNESTGVNVDVLPGLAEFVDMTGSAVLMANGGGAGINAGMIQLLGDGLFTGDDWNIESLELSPGQVYEIDPSTELNIAELLAEGSNCLPIAIRSSEGGRAARINFVSGARFEIFNLQLRDLWVDPLNTYAGDGSINEGNTTGWIFPTDTDLRFLGNDRLACGDSSIVLAPFAASEIDSIIWNGGESMALTYTVEGPMSQQVVAQVFFADGCDLRDTILVRFDEPFVVDIGMDTTICAGESLTVDVGIAADTYDWSTGDMGASIDVDQGGSYAVAVSRGACVATAAILVTAIEVEEISLGVDTTFCEGTIYTLEAPPLSSGGYLWSDGSTASTLMVREADTYWVEIGQDRCVVRDSVVIGFDPSIGLDLGRDTVICAGTAFQLDAGSGMDSYRWNTGDTTQRLPIGQTDNYEVDVTRGACREQAFVLVTVSDIAPVDLGGDRELCEGDTLPLTAPNPTNSITYQWFDGTSDPSKDITTAGVYWLEAQEGLCTRRDSIEVTFEMPIALSLGEDTTVCAGADVLIDAGSGMDSYRWNTGDTTMSINVNTSETYQVTVTRGSCTMSVEKSVTFIDIATFSVGNDTILCQGQELLLRYPPNTPPGSMWSDGSRNDSLEVDTSGVYWLEIGIDNCARRDSVEVTFDDRPNIFLGNDTTLCSGESLLLAVEESAEGVTWSTRETGSSIEVSQMGSVSVEVVQGACIVSDTIAISYISLDGLNIGNDTTLCEGQTIDLAVSLPGVMQYEWTEVISGDVLSMDPSLVVSQSGTYRVVASAERCSTQQEISIDFDEAISFEGLGESRAICEGDSIVYNFAIPQATYLWQDGSTSGRYTVRDLSDSLYALTVSRGVCTESDSVIIRKRALPAIDLPEDLAICEGDTRMLNPGSLQDVTYSWSDGSSDSILVVSQADTYVLIVSDDMCQSTDSTRVIVNQLPEISLGRDTAICSGQSLTIGVSDPDLRLEWSTGESTQEIIIADAKIYSVVGINDNECESSDTLQLSVNPTPQFELGDLTGLCDGEAATLSVEIPFDAILWSTEATTGTIQVSTEQIVWAEANIGTCIFRDSTEVVVQALPVVNLGMDTILCERQSITLDATNPGATYIWSTGATTSSIDITNAATYSVLVDIGGCTASDDIVITTQPSPVIDLGGDFILCEGDVATLNARETRGTIIWSTGETGSQITVNNAGTYTASADLDGCIAMDEVVVTREDRPRFDLGDDFAICDQVNTTLTVGIDNVDILWSTGATSPSIVVRELGTYSATARTTNGCVFTDEISISNRECQRFSLYIPNTFAPLGTDRNDHFMISPTLPQNIIEYEINVFDRWGNVMYQSTDFTQGWDGRTPSYKAQPGVYTYSIRVRYFDDFEDDRTQYFNGSVTIVR